MNYLRKYTFEYFVLTKKQPDPKHWPRLQNDWGVWLIDDQKLGHSSILQIIFNANRFLRFLREVAYPGEVENIKLTPISRNKLKLLKANSVDDRYKFITAEKYEKIEKAFKADHKHLLPVLRLCYHFGLRISETLGLRQDDVYEDTLSIQRQGKSFSAGKVSTKQLKSLEKREVPYWFASPDDAYEWISSMPMLNPTTLNRKMNAALKSFKHESHDLRRSFITRALRQQHWRDVMRAAGHKDIETTLRYDQPLTKTEKKLFKPKNAGPIIQQDRMVVS
jgi:integrase